jgi:hypothetical protein
MRTRLLLSAIMCLLFFSSCSKKTDKQLPNNTSVFNTYSSLDAIYGMLQLQPKMVTIIADSGGSFYGNSGTRYIFTPGCFADATGATVTGKVQIQVTEYLKKGDMIFSKVLPVSDGEPLLSGGELYVHATQGGQEIFLRAGYTFAANVPRGGDTTKGMLLFSGMSITGDANNQVNWVQGKDSGAVVSRPFFDSLSIISDSLNWCNADRFLDTPNYQKFTVTISLNGSQGASLSAIHTYALYDSYKAVWPLGVIGSYSNGVYHEEHVADIPVHFAAFGLLNNRFYGGVVAATPKTGANYTISIAEVDPAAFKAQLNQLTR